MNLQAIKNRNKNNGGATNQQPVQEQPNVQQPVQQPSEQNYQQPVQQPSEQNYQQPVQQPVYQQQPVQEPIYRQPQQTREPIYGQEPVYTQPVQEPIYQQEPVYQEPVYQQPAYQQPVYPGFTESGEQTVDGRKIYRKVPQSQPVHMPVNQPMPYYDEGYGFDTYNRKPVARTASLGRPLTPEEMKESMIVNLGLDPQADIEIYRPQLVDVEPLDFEIKDSTGSIANKLESLEKELKLSVIPFKVAGINRFVSEIPGYDIITDKDGEKYASANDHIASKQLVESYKLDWKNKLMVGEIVNEDITITYETEAKSYRLCSLNHYEINFLLTLFKNYNAASYSIDGECCIAIAAVKTQR